MAGMFDLGSQPDHPPVFCGSVCGEGDDVVERRDFKLPIERGRAQLRQALAGTQRLQLRQREVFGEPPCGALAVDSLGRSARCEPGMLRHIGGAGNLVLMPCHQNAVAGADQIRLDQIRAVLDCLRVGRQRVFRAQRAGAAMADDHCFAGRHGYGLLRDRCRGASCRGQQQAETNGQVLRHGASCQMRAWMMSSPCFNSTFRLLPGAVIYPAGICWRAGRILPAVRCCSLCGVCCRGGMHPGPTETTNHKDRDNVRVCSME